MTTKKRPKIAPVADRMLAANLKVRAEVRPGPTPICIVRDRVKKKWRPDSETSPATNEYVAALNAKRDGEVRHGGRKKPAINWQSVVDLIVAAGKVDVILTERIRAKSVRGVLTTLKQTEQVKLAAGDYYPAFIKWVQRWRKRERRLTVKNM